MPASPLLLLTSLPAAAAWRGALAAAMPGERVVTAGDRFDRDAVEVAVVADPHPGALRGLPRLGWMQSLWAGVDRLAADATLPDGPVARLVDPTLARAMAEAAAAAIVAAAVAVHRRTGRASGGFDRSREY